MGVEKRTGAQGGIRGHLAEGEGTMQVLMGSYKPQIIPKPSTREILLRWWWRWSGGEGQHHTDKIKEPELQALLFMESLK